MEDYEIREIDDGEYIVWKNKIGLLPSRPSNVDYHAEVEGEEITATYPDRIDDVKKYRGLVICQTGKDITKDDEEAVSLEEWRKRLEGSLEENTGSTSTKSMGRGNLGGKDQLR